MFGLKKIFKSNKENKPSKIKPKGPPVVETLQFKTHVATTTKSFEFLIHDFDFKCTENDFFSREHRIVYTKGAISVVISIIVGELPHVYIKNENLPYDESIGLDNRINIEDLNTKAQEIRKTWQQRRILKRERLNYDDLDFRELEEDYKLYGQKEHIEYLEEAAKTIFKHLKLKQ